MVSPYVRRRQLAAAITEAREAAGLTHEQLAQMIGYKSRQRISRLENSHVKPDPAEVFRILDALGIKDEKWSFLAEVANEAAETGWWASYGDAMKSRQVLYADLESGAHLIREFQPLIPGLLQTVPFAQHRQAPESTIEDESTSPRNRQAVEARQTRQRMLMRPGGPMYEVVLDEVAILRAPAPPSILGAQLRRLVEVSSAPRVTVRVLPVNALIRGYRVARSAFSLYTYPGPHDPQVVAVDTVTADMVLTSLDQPEQVERYVDLYGRLAEAALSPEDSITYLSKAAAEIKQGAG